MYRDQETTPYGAPLTEVELEDLRCLIGSHFFKDIGNEDGRGQCVNCGVKEGD